MTEIKLFDAERKLMENLWADGDLSAKELADRMAVQVEWSKPTTYTVIRKCVAKGAIRRVDPGFICHALISRDAVCQQETRELLERNFNGSADRLVASLLSSKKLSAGEIAHMKELIKELE